jgi:hypothetical protein
VILKTVDPWEVSALVTEVSRLVTNAETVITQAMPITIPKMVSMVRTRFDRRFRVARRKDSAIMETLAAVTKKVYR